MNKLTLVMSDLVEGDLVEGDLVEGKRGETHILNIAPNKGCTLTQKDYENALMIAKKLETVEDNLYCNGEVS